MICKNCKKYSDFHTKCNNKESHKFGQHIQPNDKKCNKFIAMTDIKSEKKIEFPKMIDINDEDFGDYWGLYPPVP